MPPGDPSHRYCLPELLHRSRAGIPRSRRRSISAPWRWWWRREARRSCGPNRRRDGSDDPILKGRLPIKPSGLFPSEPGNGKGRSCVRGTLPEREYSPRWRSSPARNRGASEDAPSAATWQEDRQGRGSGGRILGEGSPFGRRPDRDSIVRFWSGGAHRRPYADEERSVPPSGGADLGQTRPNLDSQVRRNPPSNKRMPSI